MGGRNDEMCHDVLHWLAFGIGEGHLLAYLFTGKIGLHRILVFDRFARFETDSQWT